MHRVRVRGIYATALSIILLEKGFILVDASDVIKSRIRGPIPDAPPHVTVKSLEDRPDEILVIGYPWKAGEEVEKAILDEVGYAAVRRGRLGLYTVAKAVIERGEEGCRAILPGGVAARVDGPCREGEAVVTVVRDSVEPGIEPVVRIGAAAVGEYSVVFYPGEGVSVSEHVRSRTARVDLMAYTMARLDVKTYHVKYRSSARSVDVETAVSEAVRLAEEARKVYESSGDGIIRLGERLSFIYLPSPAKRVLDEKRRSVIPTIDMHHSLKAGGREESLIVDYAENAVTGGCSPRSLGEAALRYITGRIKKARITLDHYKPSGGRYRLGPYTVSSASINGLRVVLTLEREIRSPGVLDGLGVEKKPGDKVTTIIDTSKWHIIHEYRASDGSILGYYLNVNTPPELSLHGVRYLDLYIDVVKRPGEEPEIIDREQLDEAYEAGIVTRDLYEKAMEEAEKGARALSSFT